jgi:hypothetical protein
MSLSSLPNNALGTLGYLEDTSKPIAALGLYISGDGDFTIDFGILNLSALAIDDIQLELNIEFICGEPIVSF